MTIVYANPNPAIEAKNLLKKGYSIDAAIEIIKRTYNLPKSIARTYVEQATEYIEAKQLRNETFVSRIIGIRR